MCWSGRAGYRRSAAISRGLPWLVWLAVGGLPEPRLGIRHRSICIGCGPAWATLLGHASPGSHRERGPTPQHCHCQQQQPLGAASVHGQCDEWGLSDNPHHHEQAGPGYKRTRQMGIIPSVLCGRCMHPSVMGGRMHLPQSTYAVACCSPCRRMRRSRIGSWTRCTGTMIRMGSLADH